jgi:NAD(P)-dependent dehydrogenase (short-subunit alcohol dehydrogenase family)
MKEEVILITGAGSGMGEATAVMAAERGARVVIADVNQAVAQKVAEKIISLGGEAIAIRCDISDGREVKSMIEGTVGVFGRVDAAFNNAGIQLPNKNTDEFSEDEYDHLFNINLRGVWLCMKYELQQMKKQGSGAIVNNSSIGGLVAGPSRALYHAAKHGILGLTKSAAAEYASKGIRINAVCPGTIETPMVAAMIKDGDLSLQACIDWAPIKRLGKAEEVAEAVLWLLSPASSYVIGQPFPVDGGLSIL